MSLVLTAEQANTLRDLIAFGKGWIDQGNRSSRPALMVEALTSVLEQHEQGKSITFIAKSGGDGESFCWLVSREVYERVTGERYKLRIGEQRVWLYPNGVLRALGVDWDMNDEYEITISVRRKKVGE